MPIRYGKPPVDEALCELYFSGSKWDDTVIGSFFTSIEKDFPERTRAGDGDSSAPRSSERSGSPRMRFFSPNHGRAIQIGRDIVVVNQRTPYPHFADWLPTVVDAAKKYVEVAHPSALARVALRYVNRIGFTETRVELEKLFTIAPRIPPSWQDSHESFLVRMQKHEGGSLQLFLTFGSSDPLPPDKLAVLLDLYCVYETSGGVPTDDAGLSNALCFVHDAVSAGFESSITDELRRKFEPQS